MAADQFEGKGATPKPPMDIHEERLFEPGHVGQGQDWRPTWECSSEELRPGIFWGGGTRKCELVDAGKPGYPRWDLLPRRKGNQSTGDCLGAKRGVGAGPGPGELQQGAPIRIGAGALAIEDDEVLT